jgi:hypothetical protein
MEPGAGEADQDVTVADAGGTQDMVFFDTADDESGEVVVWWGVDARHFGGFAAHECAAVFAASSGDASDDTFDHGGVEFTERDVVEEEEWERALDEDIVDAVVDQVVADRVVAVSFDCDFDFGADAVGGRDEEGLVEPFGHSEHAAETAEPAACACGVCGFDEGADSVFCVV